MDFADYANMLIGVAEGVMIIDGIVFCETCWKTKLGPEDCSCVGEAVVKCGLCVTPPLDPRTPCAACFPERFENWTAAMALFDEIMGPYQEEQEQQNQGEENQICENCFGSYKDVTREKPPCHLCSLAFKDAWARSRYGALSCEACKTVYSPDATIVCSACHPKFIEDSCGPQDDGQDNDRYGREYCRTYGV
jgi:hypothetical protein